MTLKPLTPLAKLFLRIGAVSGASAVILGAIGAHKLTKDYKSLNQEKATHLMAMFEKANKYHFINSSMLIVSSVIARYPLISCGLFLGSIIGFSGPLYYQAFTTEYSGLNKVAPYGGTCAILGWLSLVLVNL